MRYAETDQMGVVYHANYLVWCEIGRTDFIRQHGSSYADMERAGIQLAVSDVSLRLLGSARYDDVIRVTTTLVEVQSRRIIFDYAIARAADDARLADARTALVSLSAEHRPRALPPEVRERLERALPREVRERLERAL